MSERRRLRRFKPPMESLDKAIEAQRGIAESERARDQAFLDAAIAGWSLREIGEATGQAASTVLRACQRAENR